MSQSWIKMRTNLLSHPKVATMALKLRQPIWATVGAIFAVWSAADQHTENGELHMTAAGLDAITGIRGIAEAMASVGWLVDGGDRLTIPEFTKHQGWSAKARALDSVRKNSAKVPRDVRDSSGEVPADNRKKIGREPDLEKEEDKRKKKTEEKDSEPLSRQKPDGEKPRATPAPPTLPEGAPAVLNTPEFTATWAKWLRDRQTRGKRVTDGAAEQQLKALGEFAAFRGVPAAIAALEVCIKNSWLGVDWGIKEVEKNPPARPASSGTTTGASARPLPPMTPAELWTAFDALPDEARAEFESRTLATLMAGTRAQQAAAKYTPDQRRKDRDWINAMREWLPKGGGH